MSNTGEWKVCALAACAACAMLQVCGWTVAERGCPAQVQICVASPAEPSAQYAAEELQGYVRKLTGVELPVAERVPAKGMRAVRIEVSGVNPDAFQLKLDGDVLTVSGGKAGVLYGVYELLETYGGCGWFASWHEVVPRLDRFEVPDGLNVSDAPAFALREPFWKDAFEPDFAARLRINGNRAKLAARHGGQPLRYHHTLGIAHTFERLVPCSRFFDAHPEYFCEIGGRRQRLGAKGQLCLTNPDLVGIVVSNVLAALAEDPGARVIGVSQNDNDRYCRCARCEAVNAEEGSTAGTLVRFVNAVAERVAAHHPHVLIQTLAYMHTRHPPKLTRPRPNVAPCLCSIECDFSTPLSEGAFAVNREFVEDLRGWAEISRQLLIWNYCTDFHHYLKPFPNLPSIRGNLKLFRDCRVCGVMEQGAYQGWHGEFAELKAYLQAKWMWNPALDEKALLDRFFVGYYGKGAPMVRAYLDFLLAEAKRQKGRPLKIFDALDDGITFTDAFCEKASALWRQAEEAVSGDAAYSYNVKTSALPVDYLRFFRRSKTVRLVLDAADFRPFDVETARHLDATLHMAESAGRSVMFCEQWGVSSDARRRIADAASGKTKIVGDGRKAVLEEDVFALLRGREHLSVRDDAQAADGKALRLENNHYEWYAQCNLGFIQCDPGVKYRLRVRARVELKSGAKGEAFSFGVWDSAARRKAGARSITADKVKGTGYAWYDGFDFVPGASCILWAAPGRFNTADTLSSPVHDGVWIDCVELARVD